MKTEQEIKQQYVWECETSSFWFHKWNGKSVASINYKTYLTHSAKAEGLGFALGLTFNQIYSDVTDGVRK